MLPSIKEIDEKYFQIKGELATMNINAGMIYKLLQDFVSRGGQIYFQKEIKSEQLHMYDKIYPIGGSGYGRCAAFYQVYKETYPDKLMLPHGMFIGFEFLHHRYSAYLSVGRFNAKKVVYSSNGKVRAGDSFVESLGGLPELDESAYNPHALTIDFWKDILYFEENNLSDHDVKNIIEQFEETTERLNAKINEIKERFDQEYYRFQIPEQKAFVTFNETLSPFMIRLMCADLPDYSDYTIFALDLN